MSEATYASSVITIPPACDGTNHSTGSEGHDSHARAAYLVLNECVMCGWSQPANLCASRVAAIEASTCTMTCPECGGASPWRSFWRDVAPISVEPPSAPAPAAAPSADATIQAFADFLESRRRAPGTIRQRVRHIRALASAHADLAAVTPHELDAWVRAQGAGKMPATVNTVIKSLRVFYGWAAARAPGGLATYRIDHAAHGCTRWGVADGHRQGQ